MYVGYSARKCVKAKGEKFCMKKLGILVCTYNRPTYLEMCLDSLNVADKPGETEVVIVDDHSTDEETIKLIRESGYTAILNNKNQSIKHSLIIGCDFLFDVKGCDEIINLDADALVKSNFIAVLQDLKNRFSAQLITGFNCVTRNLNGTERHKVLMQSAGYNMKQSVGGVNLYFDVEQYCKWIKPALVLCLETQGNWDHLSCIAASKETQGVICAVPSVVQHIGIESSMGHSTTEPPDVADDFELTPLDRLKISDYRTKMHRKATTLFKMHLSEVTLVGADCYDLSRLIKAIDISCLNIQFGAVKIFSDSVSQRVTKIKRLHNKTDYSVFMMKELGKHIYTSHVLVVQHDGFLLNPQAWDNDWLQWDYIGAPWEWYKEHQVGNGGFSLRSKRLHDILARDPSIIPQNQAGVTRNKEEDHCICRLYRNYLETKYKIKFAPVEVARKFSIEAWQVPPPGNKYTGQFGFHGYSVDFSDAPADKNPKHLIKNL